MIDILHALYTYISIILQEFLIFLAYEVYIMSGGCMTLYTKKYRNTRNMVV